MSWQRIILTDRPDAAALLRTAVPSPAFLQCTAFNLTFFIVVEWNVAASTLPLIVVGDSAAGKDNLKRVVLDWLHKLEPAGRPATRALLQGSITVTGLIEELLDNDNQLQIINGELEKVINRKTPRFTRWVQDGI